MRIDTYTSTPLWVCHWTLRKLLWWRVSTGGRPWSGRNFYIRSVGPNCWKKAICLPMWRHVACSIDIILSKNPIEVGYTSSDPTAAVNARSAEFYNGLRSGVIVRITFKQVKLWSVTILLQIVGKYSIRLHWQLIGNRHLKVRCVDIERILKSFPPYLSLLALSRLPPSPLDDWKWWILLELAQGLSAGLRPAQTRGSDLTSCLTRPLLQL